jgi:nuclear pore complex protein Nup98-Nup96
LFGNQNQQKPTTGSLFGNNAGATGGGLLGLSTTNNNNAFGNNNQQQGGLFGNKPAGTAGGGLFGNNTATQNTGAGGGLFGNLGNNQQQQQTQGGGLFGGMNNSTQNKPNSLFGTSTQTGGGMFGGQNNAQQGGLFGNSTNQQQQNNGLGNSLFGNSMNNQAQNQTLTASVNDPSAYGTGSVFGNLSTPTNDPGPLATPLSSKKQGRRPSILPMYKLNPASASRFSTPQKRGFGFSYSTYGTPNSPSSVSSTPGAMTQSLLNGGSLSRSLAKSISTNNLRRSFNVEDTLLAPGAFSASTGPRYMGGNSVKKLVINRELRSDLFSTPTKDSTTDDNQEGSRKVAKRVSFENTETPKAIEAPNGSASNTPSAEELGYIRPARTNGVNGSKDGALSTPEVEIKGKELAIVHEEDVGSPVSKPSPAAGSTTDKELGEYWMEPSKEEIQNMNRVQRQKVQNFTVGRKNSGWVKFKVPVDLTNIDLDNLYDNIVVLEIRSCTVYPNPAKKPAVGKGLNVPSLINLENSWPRAAKTRGKANTSLAKHIERLKRIEGTTFENYNKETGEWTFSVEHFTTYGLDYDEEDETEAEPSMEPITSRGPRHDSESLSPPTHPDFDQDDDAFDFGHSRRSLPGAFDDDAEYEDEESVEMAQVHDHRSSFLASRSAGSTSKALVPAAQEDLDDEYGSYREEDASTFPGHHHAAEPDEDSFAASQMELVTETPAGIMRARMRAIKGSSTPAKVTVTAGDDWMDMLQKTISPQKRDRALLKSIHEADAYRPKDSIQLQSPAKKRVVSDARGFATSIDLMKSIFDQAKAPVEKPQPAVRPANVKVGCF